METLNHSSLSKLFLSLQRKPFKLESCLPSPVLLNGGQQDVLPLLYLKGPLHCVSCSHFPLSGSAPSRTLPTKMQNAAERPVHG